MSNSNDMHKTIRGSCRIGGHSRKYFRSTLSWVRSRNKYSNLPYSPSYVSPGPLGGVRVSLRMADQNPMAHNNNLKNKHHNKWGSE